MALYRPPGGGGRARRRPGAAAGGGEAPAPRHAPRRLQPRPAEARRPRPLRLGPRPAGGEAGARPLPLRRRRPRQVDADGPVLRERPGRARSAASTSTPSCRRSTPASPGRAPRGATDPVRPVADAIADGATLLCFDEMQITDITDAMLVGRLFERLFERGVVIVTTSNRAPDELYKDGLNRNLFLPFIALIEERLEVHELASATDHRLDRLAGAAVYHVPARPRRDRRPRRRLEQPRARTGPAADPDRARPRRHPPRLAQRRRPRQLRPALRPAARPRRLPRHRRGHRRADPRRHPGAQPRAQQRGQALRHADRRALRGQGPPDLPPPRPSPTPSTSTAKAPSSSPAPPRGCTRCGAPAGAGR